MLLIGEGLKRELSESELAASQFDQTVEHRCGIAKACGQVLLHTMKDLLEMIDDRHDAEDPLNDHAIITLSMLTKLPIDWLVSTFAEAQIAEDFGLIGPPLADFTKVLVMRVSGGPRPVNNLPLGSNQPAEFDSDNPAMITEAFLAHLGRTAPLPNRVNQLNTIAINHALCLWLDQELIRQVLIGGQQPQQAGTFRQVGKQVHPVPFEPAIKGTIVHAFERKQDANCDNLAGIQVGVAPLVDVRQFIVYHTKESNDDVFGSHRVVLLFAILCVLAQASHNLLAFSTFLLSTSNIGYL